LADVVHGDPPLVDPSGVDTNIVMVDVGHSGADAPAWIAALQDRGLRAGAWSRTSLRLVTHRHIDDAAVEQASDILRAVAGTWK
jgi:threonine aldolase